MGDYSILKAAGDGIGPEIMAEAVKVLGVVADRFGHVFSYEEELVGGAAIAVHGVAITEEGLARAKEADAILFGAVGDPRYDDPAASVRPEQAILALRGGLELFANLRPVSVREALAQDSPLKAEVVRGVDLLIFRELTGGIYFGEPSRRWAEDGRRRAVDTMAYSEPEVERIVRAAFECARARSRRVTSVDKANVLETSRLWRTVASEVAGDYPDVELEHMLVDACAMHLINQPARFDVIVTENMFGDILTDEASMLTGSLGMMPSACLGKRREDGTSPGLFEPIHGSAPDITGQGLANPLGMILSAAMMLRMGLGLDAEAAAIEDAVDAVLGAGMRTADIAGGAAARCSTVEMGDAVARAVEAS